MAKTKVTPKEEKPKYRIIKQEIITFTKKQQVGRVLFFIVGLAFAAISIVPIVEAIMEIAKLGFKGDAASYYYLFQIIAGMMSIVLFAYSCFVASIKAKIGIKTIIYFVAILLLLITQTVLFFVNKQTINPRKVLVMVAKYLLPVGYVVAFGLLASGKHY